MRADARRNVERILEATTELIATDPGASMERVAAAAGVSRATLYHHFHSRDALMDTLTDQSIGEVTAALAARAPGGGHRAGGDGARAGSPRGRSSAATAGWSSSTSASSARSCVPGSPPRSRRCAR